jgi:hypothetical protein
MPALQSGDMGTKIASSGPYAGETRDKIFELKIKDGKEFTIGSTESGPKVIGVSYDPMTRKFSYYTKTNKSVIETVNYNRIFKDPDFGGGKGSGGGADDTRYTESLQCYFCSYVFNVAKKKITHASPAELEKGTRYVVASETLNNCLDKGPKLWLSTDVYIKTANRLFDEYGRKMLSPVYFHRGSTFMDNIYAAKSKCHKIDKATGSPQAPGSFSHDKWNPGDIWASTFSVLETPLADYTSNWGELNERVYDLAKNGKLLGISLKKIEASALRANYQQFNAPTLAPPASYTFGSWSYGKTGDFFKSQDIYIRIGAKEVQFRTTGGTTQWQGEIKGFSAAGGKIGGGNVHFYCKEVFGKGIYGDYDTEAQYLEWFKRNESNGVSQQRMYDLYKKYNSRSTPSLPLIDQAEFMKNLAAIPKLKEYNFKNSKMICLEFLDVIMSGTTAQRDQLATKMFRYAESATDQSSYFIKLY